MKKNTFISSALAFMALTSCQQEKLDGNTTELDGFRVRTEEMTKAVLDGVKVVFEDNDAIDIYPDGKDTPSVYAYSQANDIFVATGTEAEGAEYTAIFPAQTNKSRSIINIPWKQFATVNSFPKNAMYMAGTSTSKELMLKHLVGLWEIDLLPQYDRQKLVRADLTMNGGQKINGNFEINWSDNTIVYVDEGRSAILLSGIDYVMTAGEPVKLYFALPEGKYEGGFTFTATMTDGTIMDVTSPSTINIARGQITKVKNDVPYRLFASGTGTENDPYVIKSANHWKNMVTKVNKDAKNYASAYYKLEADIDFKNEVIDSIHVFKGVLDGGNKTLKNAKIGDGTASHQAFFYLLSGTVKNLKFDNITVTGGNATGAASSAAVITAGNSSAAFTIENCHVSNCNVTSGGEGSYAAGLVARCEHSDVLIRNCSVKNCTITAGIANVGGVVGMINKGMIDNIQSSDNTITAGSRCCGGVVGGCGTAVMLLNVISEDNTCIAQSTMGGVVGNCTSHDESNTTKIMNVLSNGNLMKSLTGQAKMFVGGIVGGHENPKAYMATLVNCIVLDGNIEYNYTGTDSAPVVGCVGLIVGYSCVVWDNCIYNQVRRDKFDEVFTQYVQANYKEITDYNKNWSYRYAVGVKKNAIARASDAGTDKLNNVTCLYYNTSGLQTTALTKLNDWVNSNKETYKTLKSWISDANNNNLPTLVLKETATSGVNSLNIVESNY